jgi:hypothetical protein
MFRCIERLGTHNNGSFTKSFVYAHQCRPIVSLMLTQDVFGLGMHHFGDNIIVPNRQLGPRHMPVHVVLCPEIVKLEIH